MLRVRTSSPQIGDAECAAVERVLRSGYLGAGPEVAAFERELATYLERDSDVVCVSSGTSALHLALDALGLAPGDEVLVPTLTYVATFQAVAAAGAVAVACDVDPSSALLSLDDARRRLTSRTRALLPVHYAGNPGNLSELRAFAQQHGLRVVEDAAHAFGSHANGMLVGGDGDIVCFSFDPIKNITAGQGGAIVTSDPLVLERVRRRRDLGVQALTDPRGAADFDVEECGWRYAMSDLMAAIGRVQLGRFEAEIKPARIALANAYRAHLGRVGAVTLLETEAGSVPHIVPVRLPARHRDAVRARLAEAGYECKVHYKPNHLLRAFAGSYACPNAELLYAELLTLPTHHGVSMDDVRAVTRIIADGTAS